MTFAKVDSIIRKAFLVAMGIWLVANLLVMASDILYQDYTFVATDHSGDGIGGVADIGFLKTEPLFQYNRSNYVAPYMLPPTTMVDQWRVVKQLLSLIFFPDNVYDFLVITFWILNGLAGFFLCRTLKLNCFASILFGLTIAGSEAVFSRISGHLTMAAIFIPIFQIGYAFKLMEKPTIKNIVLFAFFSFLCFLSNEYYGYFGFLFSAALVGSYYLINFRKIREFPIFGVVLGILVFVFGMVIVYWDIFLNLFVKQEMKTLLVHSYFDHVYYSVKNPLEIFYSPSYRLNLKLMNPGEFTYHIGIGILFCIIALLLYAIIRKIQLDLRLILPVLFAGIVLALFGLNPDIPFSLAKITYRFAPQFRVAARAYLWVTFAIIIIAALLYRDVVQNITANSSNRSSILLPLSSLLLIVILFDVTMGLYTRGPPLYPLPENAAYKAIADREPGLLLELPFYGPFDSPELSYQYLYNHIDHGKQVLNYPVFQMKTYDPLLAVGVERFKHFVNSPDEEVIDLLKHSGVEYIAVSDPVIKADFDSMGYQPIVDEDNVAIYDLNASSQYDLKSVFLCNANILDYDLTEQQDLPSQGGAWSTNGIASTGTDGALLFGPYTPLVAGDYTFRMEGLLKAGSAKVDIVSNKEGRVYLEVSIDPSFASNDGKFTIQQNVEFDENVQDVEVRVWVNPSTNIEVHSYSLETTVEAMECEGLVLGDE